MRETGIHLYSAIFAENAEQLVELARFRAGNEPVTLEIEPTEEFVDLPWEWLVDPASHRFLALSDRLSLVRWRSAGESLDPPQQSAREVTEQIPTTQFELARSEQVLADRLAFYATVTGDPQMAAERAAQRSELTSAAARGQLPLVSPSSVAFS